MVEPLVEMLDRRGRRVSERDCEFQLAAKLAAAPVRVTVVNLAIATEPARAFTQVIRERLRRIPHLPRELRVAVNPSHNDRNLVHDLIRNFLSLKNHFLPLGWWKPARRIPRRDQDSTGGRTQVQTRNRDQPGASRRESATHASSSTAGVHRALAGEHGVNARAARDVARVEHLEARRPRCERSERGLSSARPRHPPQWQPQPRRAATETGTDKYPRFANLRSTDREGVPA